MSVSPLRGFIPAYSFFSILISSLKKLLALPRKLSGLAFGTDNSLIINRFFIKLTAGVS
jgi:hypothetical protein